MLEIWKGILTQPEETISAQGAKAGLVGGLINFAIAGLIPGLLLGLVVTGLLVALGPMLSVFPGADAFVSLGMLAIVIVPIVAVIFAIIGSLLCNLGLWLGAKAGGGHGSFGAQYHLVSVVFPPLILATILVCLVTSLLMLVPFVGPLLGILFMTIAQGYLAIMAIIAYIAAMKVAHGFSTKSLAIATGVGYALNLVIFGLVIGVVALIVLMPVMGQIMALMG